MVQVQFIVYVYDTFIIMINNNDDDDDDGYENDYETQARHEKKTRRCS